jgi:putative IMPACT (imprinted ancient) family translation regulator
MLDVLLGEGIHNVCAVVTRYFGGTLLGTGGLVRAYSGAVKEGLKHSVILQKRPGKEVLVVCDYNGLGKLQYIAGQRRIPVLGTEYTDQVSARLMLPEEAADAFVKQLTEATGGRAVIEVLGTPYFAEHDGEILLFEE